MLLIPFGFDASVCDIGCRKNDQMLQSTLHDNDTCVAKDLKKYPKGKLCYTKILQLSFDFFSFSL
jgi:hypothetical protein